MNIETSVFILFATFAFFLFTGLPLSFVLGGVAIFFSLFLWGPDSILLVIVQTWDTMTNYYFVAIPLYIFMANILQRSGVIEDLFNAMQVWFGPVRGGLAIGVVVICTIMAAMTGIVGAAVASMGILALPEMLNRRYDKKLALGTICAGGTLGILIPPSVVTVVYAVTASLSIGKLFIGAIGPGLLLSGLYILYIAIRCWLNPKLGPAPPQEERERITWMARIKVLRSVALPSLLVFAVLGTIYFGIATPTEAAAVGSVGALFSAAMYQRLSKDLIIQSTYTTATVTCMILWITIGARCFISVFTAIGGGDLVTHFVTGLELNRWVILILIFGLLTVLGCFLDEIGIILLCVPIFMPIIQRLGFDPIWFGLLFLVNAQTAYISPPFGYTLFYLKGVAPEGVTMGDIYRAVIPFIFIQILGMAICMVFPDIMLYLPSLMKE
ncbi:MAG: TRAP transporter large permease [Thermodesulfobacteriota bacterium]